MNGKSNIEFHHSGNPNWTLRRINSEALVFLEETSKKWNLQFPFRVSMGRQ